MAKRETGTPGAAKAGDVIDVGQAMSVSPDEVDAATTGKAILQWFGGLAGFFTTARAMEGEAALRLTRAQALEVPITKAEDERMQKFVLDTTEQLAGVEAHWNITTQIHKLHRRMTAARSRTTDSLDTAKSIGNRLHNTYVENEKRRAREEEERINREREAAAQRQRAEELAAAEAEALRREAAAPTLSEREGIFVDHLFGGKLPAQAAKLAGYKNPEEVGPRMAGSAKVVTALTAKREAATIRTQAEAKRAEPVQVERVEVKPEISRASGGHDRTTRSLEILDLEAFRKAAFSGQHGIPLDCFTIDQAKCNSYARDWREQVNRWPGVRLKTNTGVV